MSDLHCDKNKTLYLFTVTVVVPAPSELGLVCGSSPVACTWPLWQADAPDCAVRPLYLCAGCLFFTMPGLAYPVSPAHFQGIPKARMALVRQR